MMNLRLFGFFHVALSTRCLEIWIDRSGESSEMDIRTGYHLDGQLKPIAWIRCQVRLEEDKGSGKGERRAKGAACERRTRRIST
jgi:hypothetical protein